MKKISDQILDDLVRKNIRLISGGYCKRCRKYVGIENIEVAHLYPRRRKTVRWDLRNVWPLCKNNLATGEKGCHQIIDEDHIKKASFQYDVMTREEVAELERIASLTLKDYPIDREAIKASLKEKNRILEER